MAIFNFFQMLMNALLKSTNALLMHIVPIPMDHTTAPVIQDILEMDLTARVSLFK